MATLNKVTDQSFSGFIMGEKPTLILFGASWSGHTVLMEQVLESVGDQFADDIQIGSALADDCAKSIARFGISRVPSLAIFKKGRLVGVRIGRQTREDTSSFIRESL